MKAAAKLHTADNPILDRLNTPFSQSLRQFVIISTGRSRSFKCGQKLLVSNGSFELIVLKIDRWFPFLFIQ